MKDIYEISAIIQDNNKDEAEAIAGYSRLLDKVLKSELEGKEKAEISSNIREIIADELNHQERLQKVYSILTMIEPNKE